jgi:hypothetical protein
MSRLLEDIIEKSVAGCLTLDVVARFDSREFLEETLRTISPDLILVGLRPGESDEVARSLLALAPLAKVIAMSSDARHGYVHEMRPHRTALIEISRQILIRTILRKRLIRRSRSFA